MGVVRHPLVIAAGGLEHELELPGLAVRVLAGPLQQLRPALRVVAHHLLAPLHRLHLHDQRTVELRLRDVHSDHVHRSFLPPDLSASPLLPTHLVHAGSCAQRAGPGYRSVCLGRQKQSGPVSSPRTRGLGWESRSPLRVCRKLPRHGIKIQGWDGGTDHPSRCPHADPPPAQPGERIDGNIMATRAAPSAQDCCCATAARARSGRTPESRRERRSSFRRG